MPSHQLKCNYKPRIAGNPSLEILVKIKKTEDREKYFPLGNSPDPSAANGNSKEMRSLFPLDN